MQYAIYYEYIIIIIIYYYPWIEKIIIYYFFGLARIYSEYIIPIHWYNQCTESTPIIVLQYLEV